MRVYQREQAKGHLEEQHTITEIKHQVVLKKSSNSLLGYKLGVRKQRKRSNWEVAHFLSYFQHPVLPGRQLLTYIWKIG